MSNAWFRMYSDFLEDAKMISLAFEDQRHFIGVLALKSSGLLDQSCASEVMDKLVAQKLWIDRSAIVEVKRRLIDAVLIDENWQPLAWDKRQFVSDRDPTAAERQRRKREKDRENKDMQSVTDESRVTVTEPVTPCHAPVTPPDTDTDTDTEKDVVRLARTPSRFEEFWNSWPRSDRKRNKADCQRIWSRKKLNDIADVIIADVLFRAKSDRLWLDGYDPMPSTYLNKRTWEDGAGNMQDRPKSTASMLMGGV